MSKMPRCLQLEDGQKIHKKITDMKEVKKELMFHRLLFFLIFSSQILLIVTALILSGVTYYLTSNSLEYQGLLISKVMDGIEVIQLTNDDSGIDLNVSGNFTDKVLEKYLPERRQKMNQELRFISPRKYNTFRLLFQIFYCSIFYSTVNF